LLQYDLENWGSVSNAVNSQQNINDIQLGIDGQLYLNVHENNIPSRRIHVVRNPNSKGGGGTRAIEDVATLLPNTNGAFEFPTFIACISGGGCEVPGDFREPEFIEDKNRCTNTPVKFLASYTAQTYDSIRWDFDDPGNPESTSTDSQIIRNFPEEKLYSVKCFAFYCSFIDTFHFPLDMKHPIDFSLGTDTTLCFGSSLNLEIPLPYDTFKWSDGHLENNRTVQTGSFEAIIRNETCILRDTITVSQYPDIWTELESEYYICDLDQEAVKLDAGKGFQHYMWYPTGDTSQWI